MHFFTEMAVFNFTSHFIQPCCFSAETIGSALQSKCFCTNLRVLWTEHVTELLELKGDFHVNNTATISCFLQTLQNVAVIEITVSLSHCDHFKKQTSATLRPFEVTDREANQYIELYQLLALGNKERSLQTMIKKSQNIPNHHKTFLNV